MAGAGSRDQSVRCGGVDADEYSTLAAGGNGHVTTNEKGEPTEHLRLSHSGLVDEELTDALGEIVVVGHGAILGMRRTNKLGDHAFTKKLAVYLDHLAPRTATGTLFNCSPLT